MDVMIKVGQSYTAGTDANGNIQIIHITRVGRSRCWFRYKTLDRRVVDSYNKKSFLALLNRNLIEIK